MRHQGSHTCSHLLRLTVPDLSALLYSSSLTCFFSFQVCRAGLVAWSYIAEGDTGLCRLLQHYCLWAVFKRRWWSFRRRERDCRSRLRGIGFFWILGHGRVGLGTRP